MNLCEYCVPRNITSSLFCDVNFRFFDFPTKNILSYQNVVALFWFYAWYRRDRKRVQYNVWTFCSLFFFGYVNFVCITNAFRLNCIFEKFLNVRSLFVFNSLSHPLIFKICVNQLLMSVLLYQQKNNSRSGIVVVLAVIMLWKCSKFISNAFRLTHLKNVYSCVRPSVRLSVLRSICFLTF